jgi:Cytochrome b5-like Heme/Steroid binding domain/F-box domain
MVFLDFWSAMMSSSSNDIYASNNDDDDCSSMMMMTLGDILVTLSSLCGVQVMVVATLGAITIYRREMSCNHCYHPAVTAAAAAVVSAAAASTTTTAAVSDAVMTSADDDDDDDAEDGVIIKTATTTSSITSASTSPLFSSISCSATSPAAATTTPSFCHDDDDENDHDGRRDECCSYLSSSDSDRHTAACAAAAAASGAAADENDSHNHHDTQSPLLVCGDRPLAPDVLVHILSFLSPRDVIAFGCTSHAARIVVHGNSKKENNSKKNSSDGTTTTTAAAAMTARTSSLSTAASTRKMTTSAMLWKTLWRRDFAWIVESWIIGRQAVQRTSTSSTTASSSILATKQTGSLQTDVSLALSSSNPQQQFHLANNCVTFDADFYFRFAASWMNFVLAGRNCVQNGCYVGLAGHVYDMTTFVLIHPGSPETVLVQAGRDATAFFLNVRHSAGALRLTKSMCVVVDQSRIILQQSQPGDENENNNKDSSPTIAASEKQVSSSSTTTTARSSCGLRPTRHIHRLGSPLLRMQQQALQQQHELPQEQCTIPELSLSNMGRYANNNNMLQRIQTLHAREEAQALQCAKQKYSTTLRLTDVNVFYNPFLQSWQAWYTNPNMETVFCPLD